MLSTHGKAMGAALGAWLVASALPAAAELHWVPRPDEMHVMWFHDVDRHEGTVRLLYSTTPSLSQGQADPDGWTSNVYLVEATTDGSVRQRRLASFHAHLAAVVLRRGHDQILIVRPGEEGGPQRLEILVTEDGSVVSSSTAPSLDESRAVDLANIVPASDGNLIVPLQQGREAVRWLKLNPQGEVVGEGSFAPGGVTVRPAGWFAARQGGLGMTVRIARQRGSNEDLAEPVRRELGGRTLVAETHGVTRMLVTDDAGALRWLSPPLERQIAWEGEMQVPQNLPMQEQMQQMQAQMRLTEEIGLELGATRTLLELERSGRRGDAVQAVPGGYGVLADVIANRRREPPAHGPYYLEVDEKGELQRQVYLGPAVESLDADVVDFVSAAEGTLSLVGAGRAGSRSLTGLVIRVNADGEMICSAKLESPAKTALGLAAGPDGRLWTFGHARGASDKTLFWVESVAESACD